MSRPSLFVLCAAVVAAGAGCAHKDRQVLDTKRANSRAMEQRAVNRIMDEYASDNVSERGAEIVAADPNRTFDPTVARFGHAASVSTRSSQAPEFGYEDHVRTRAFVTKSGYVKSAWMGDVKFGGAKAAPTKESWFSRQTARTKTYGTRPNWQANKESATRLLPGGDASFHGKGRRQAEFDSKGPAAQAPGSGLDGGESWSGDLKPMTIDDVKKLLNKS